jgi:hypothetical protein
MHIRMMKVFIHGASVSIVVNGKVSKAFVIEKGVWQGCMLAPYLFLIVGEAFNAKIHA